MKTAIQLAVRTGTILVLAGGGALGQSTYQYGANFNGWSIGASIKDSINGGVNWTTTTAALIQGATKYTISDPGCLPISDAPIYAFCIERNEAGVGNNVYYTWSLEDAPNTQGGMGSAKATALRRHFALHWQATWSNNLAAAFQAVTWEITKDTGTELDLTTGSYRVHSTYNGGTVFTQAQAWLTDLRNATSSTPEWPLVALSKAGKQDLVPLPDLANCGCWHASLPQALAQSTLPTSRFDLDSDGAVDRRDVEVLLGVWGASTDAYSNLSFEVPEGMSVARHEQWLGEAQHALRSDLNWDRLVGEDDLLMLFAAIADANGSPIPDSDEDGVSDLHDGCPNDLAKIEPGDCGCGVVDLDSDGDGTADCVDNCVDLSNADQADCDADGHGDACEIAGGAADTDANQVPDRCQLGALIPTCPASAMASGCTPEFTASGTPSASSGSFVLSCSADVGQSALFVYTTGGALQSSRSVLGGGSMCVALPVERVHAAVVAASSGSCGGTANFDFMRQLGHPARAGDLFTAQCWLRGPTGATALSGALQWTMAP